jgi:hypothetical protein
MLTVLTQKADDRNLNAAAYDQLLARICSVVKPLDIIEEIFIADLVFLEWEVL